jgi:wyosine [tRNA(Phe)-imidazoG37] synthetase (radical SAM superfamily)
MNSIYEKGKFKGFEKGLGDITRNYVTTLDYYRGLAESNGDTPLLEVLNEIREKLNTQYINLKAYNRGQEQRYRESIKNSISIKRAIKKANQLKEIENGIDE